MLILSAQSGCKAKAVPEQDEVQAGPGSNSIVIYSVSVLSSLLLVDLLKKRVLMPLIAKGEWNKSTEDIKKKGIWETYEEAFTKAAIIDIFEI